MVESVGDFLRFLGFFGVFRDFRELVKRPFKSPKPLEISGFSIVSRPHAPNRRSLYQNYFHPVKYGMGALFVVEKMGNFLRGSTRARGGIVKFFIFLGRFRPLHGSIFDVKRPTLSRPRRRFSTSREVTILLLSLVRRRSTVGLARAGWRRLFAPTVYTGRRH